jgi:16S rRNA U1498 N3-methylase RsmE
VASVVVGPEGGFAPGEIPGHLPLWDLGPTVLRVETAAVVAAARLLG